MSDIKELAKELCDKSGCHHKCHDTTDCVVEDEAREYLPFVLTNEGKVSTKDRCIEEMAKVLKDYTKKNHIMASSVILEDYAEMLYNAGYRKQSEGEWIKDDKSKFKHRYYCSVCGFYRIGTPSKYCEECGSKMKGGK